MKPISKRVLAKPAVKAVLRKPVGTPLDKLRVGATVSYFCRTNPRDDGGEPYRGKITEIDVKATGPWVKLHDKSRDVIITVRPTQIGGLK